jgi:hypothetical protein
MRLHVVSHVPQEPGIVFEFPDGPANREFQFQISEGIPGGEAAMGVYGNIQEVVHATQAAARSDWVLMNASKSALINSACVVGMPCGNPG